MSISELETVGAHSQTENHNLKNMMQFLQHDDEKLKIDQPNTNPTIDDQNSSNDDDIIVSYNFASDENELQLNHEQQPEQQLNDQLSQIQKTRVQSQQQIFENQIKPVILQQQQQDETVNNENQNKKESLKILMNAFGERKSSNIQNYNTLIQQRNQYFKQFTSCFLNIQEKSLKTFNETQLFRKQFVKYLKDVKLAYKNFNRDLDKISFNIPDTSDQSLWGKIIPDGFKIIIQQTQMSIQTSKTFSQWLDIQCIPKVQQAFQSYKSKVQSELKQVKNLKEQYLSKNQKNHKITKETKMKDLLLQELKVYKILQEQKSIVQEWGAATSRLMQTIYNNNYQITNMLKFQANNLIDHLKLINRQSHHLFEAQNYWNNIPLNEQSMLNRIISQWQLKQKGLCQLLESKTKLSMSDFHEFLITIDQKDNKFDMKRILRELYISTYKISFRLENGQWKPTQAYFSIDNNIILVEQNLSIKNCMNICELEHQIDQNDLKLRQKQKSIFSKWNKQKLRFNVLDQRQQFIMLIDSIKQLRMQ